MSEQVTADAAFRELTTWYDIERPAPALEPERYVVCAGLAVLERFRETFPLEEQDYLTAKNQVRTSRSVIQTILGRHGETRVYAREGGRTTRGTRTAADKLVTRLNAVSGLADLPVSTRTKLADRLQGWLVERVLDYFNRKRIEPEIDLGKSSPQIVADILDAANQRGVAGAIAQHLVGAKLAVRYPKIEVENHSVTTADQQLGRRGDFLIGDTVFHVTVAPMQAHVEKCADDIRQGYRAILLVSDSKLAAARQMAETLGVALRLGVLSIEAFVGQNIDEIGEFGKANIASGLRLLLETYNQRVGAVETNRSLLIEIPENLV